MGEIIEKRGDKEKERGEKKEEEERGKRKQSGRERSVLISPLGVLPTMKGGRSAPLFQTVEAPGMDACAKLPSMLARLFTYRNTEARPQPKGAPG